MTGTEPDPRPDARPTPAASAVARHRLGATRVEVTSLGYGGAPAGNLFRATTDAETRAAVDTAWDAGIRYFDTAPQYGLGLAERRIGAALRGRPREEYVVSTKVGRILEPVPGGAHERFGVFDVPADQHVRWDFSRDGILRSVEDSLRRTGLDRIDVVYLHDPDDHADAALGSGIDALVRLRDEGVVGAVGAGMNQSAMLTRFVRETDVDVVMCAGRLTLLEQPACADLLPAARERGVSVVAAGPYNSGLLAQDSPPSDATYDYAPAPTAVLDRARALAAACRAHGVALPQAALAFVREHGVASTVVGIQTPAQAREAAARHTAVVPAGLWAALVEDGLLDEVALPPGSA
jgi:D-threo-aldose 1-dehydrogenase